MGKRRFIQMVSVFLYNPYLENFLTGRVGRVAGKAICVPGLNCYSCPGAVGSCPVGAFQSFLSGVFPRFPFYVLGSLLLFGLLFGRLICGWACPFGLLQELFHHLPGPKMKKSRMTAALSRMKYAWALFFVILLPLAFWAATGIGVPAFCKFLCPAGTLEGAAPLLLVNDGLRGSAGTLTAWKFAVAGFFLFLMVVAWRPFCRWLCPLGAFYGLFNRYAAIGIQVDAEKCVQCGACARVCRMDTNLAGDRECLSCGDCLKDCPVGAISFRRPMFRKIRDTNNEFDF